MKTVKLYNSHVNGSNSRMNIHFEDGSQFSRTISHHDAVRIAKEGKACLEELMQKYAEPQTKRSYNYTAEDERVALLHTMRQVAPMPDAEEQEYQDLVNKSDF